MQIRTNKPNLAPSTSQLNHLDLDCVNDTRIVSHDACQCEEKTGAGDKAP